MKTVSDHRTILQELAQLVHGTFSLWREYWVGFSWRNYYFNHTQRVQALSRTLGMKEGANLTALDFAAVLHDITKRYDGEIILDSQGQRALDTDGFWHNELLLPQKENTVTLLYRQHNLFHSLRRAPIDNYVFDIGIVLVKDRAYRFFQEISLVIGRR